MLELSEKDFKAAVTKMFHQAISNSLEKNGKHKISAEKQKFYKKEQMESIELESGFEQMKRYIFILYS